MGKSILKPVLLFGLLLLGVLGCEMEQDVPIPAHEPKLSLRLALTNSLPDSLLYSSVQYSQLYIGKSQGVLENQDELLAVSDAQVELFDEAGQLVEVYTHTGRHFLGGGHYYMPDTAGGYPQGYYYYPPTPGYYEATKGFVPVPGATYTIRATAPGFEPIEATSSVPQETVASGMAFKGQRVNNGWGGNLEGNIQLSINDKPGEQNYYRIRVHPVDSTYSRAGFYEAGTIMDDVDLGTNEKFRLGNAFSDEFYTSGTIAFTSKITVTARAFEPAGDGSWREGRRAKYLEVMVEQLSKDEYLFLKTLDAQGIARDNPFAEYTPIYDNVAGGYGALGGMSVSKFYVAIE